MYYRNEKQKTFQLFLLVVITVIFTVIFIAPRFANAQLNLKTSPATRAGLIFFLPKNFFCRGLDRHFDFCHYKARACY